MYSPAETISTMTSPRNASSETRRCEATVATTGGRGPSGPGMAAGATEGTASGAGSAGGAVGGEVSPANAFRVAGGCGGLAIDMDDPPRLSAGDARHARRESSARAALDSNGDHTNRPPSRHVN